MGFWYFIRNSFKAIAVFCILMMLKDFTVEMSEDLGLCVLLFFLFFATVSTTYDLGGGWFLKVTAGVGLGGAFFGSFLVMVLSYALVNWVAENKVIVAGILLASFAINHIIETVKYAKELPVFFTVTGGLCALVFTIEALFTFLQLPALFFSLDYVDDGAPQFFLAMLTVIFMFVCIIARSTQAYAIEE